MDWSTKGNYLKRSQVTGAREIDYAFKQLWSKVILSVMHPSGQILSFDDQREFQNRGTEHMCAPIHIVDALTINGNEDSEMLSL